MDGADLIVWVKYSFWHKETISLSCTSTAVTSYNQ